MRLSVIINISGDITLQDASDASEYVRQLAGNDVNIIFGAMYDENQQESCTITVIATGIDDKQINTPVKPVAAATASPVSATIAPQPQAVAAHTPVAPVTPVTPIQPTITPIGVSSADASAAAAAGPRPTLGISRPSEIKSTVEPKSLKIPDFLQRK